MESRRDAPLRRRRRRRRAEASIGLRMESRRDPARQQPGALRQGAASIGLRMESRRDPDAFAEIVAAWCRLQLGCGWRAAETGRHRERQQGRPGFNWAADGEPQRPMMRDAAVKLHTVASIGLRMESRRDMDHRLGSARAAWLQLGCGWRAAETL